LVCFALESCRKLTSRNVVLSKTNKAKVTNFALMETRQRLASEMGAIADVAALAPEVLRGEAIDFRAADVYSFGVLLWELLTGKLPWEGESPATIIRLVGYQGAQLPLDGIDASSPLVGILSRCFLEAPQRPTFEAIVAELGGEVPRPAASNIPEEFVCPITHEVMHDPVICADGKSYERAAIEAWLQTHDSSPSTNLPLENKQLTPNIALRATIGKFLSDTPV
jgi:serine/threonine protein kinase